MKKNTAIAECPCGSGRLITDCCQPYIDGVLPAPTAEALMRSRYTAYATGKVKYLLDSWHASTRPQSVDIDPAMQWIRLSIVDSDIDHVEFVATYRIQGRAHKLHEKSRFVFEDGKWFYVGGEIKE
jgi:SEC-C motif-containing protein